MNTFSAAVDVLRKSCREYEEILKKTLTFNAELREKVDRMGSALDDMKAVFKTSPKCGICATRPQNTALECGHCLCTNCSLRALRAEKCPFCRRAVTESMRVYL